MLTARRLLCSMLGGLLLWPATACAADPIEDFYKAKTVRIVVGYGVGGGYDAYARLIARHLGRHIPGSPTVIVQNMAGAGTLTAALHVAAIAPQDGTTIGAIDAALPFLPLLDPAQTRFDPLQQNWLPSPVTDTALVIVWHTAPVTRIDEAREKEILLASSSPNATSSYYARVLNDVLKTKFRIVLGYASATESLLAMERGEVHGFPSMPWSTLKSTRPDWIRDGRLKYLVQFGARRHPEVPAATPFAPDLITDPADRALLDLVVAPAKLGKPYMLGAGVPPERVAAMRAAFAAALKDDQLIADADKLHLKLDPQAPSGEQIGQLLARTLAAPPELRARLQALYAAK